MPFCTAWERDIHFAKHGHKFGVTDATQYERMADDFTFGPRGAGTQECLRPGGRDRVRFADMTRWLAVSRVLPAPECLRTFYRVRQATVARHGGSANYFAYECGRIMDGGGRR